MSGRTEHPSTLRTVAAAPSIIAAPPGTIDTAMSTARRVAQQLSGAGHVPADIALDLNDRGLIRPDGAPWCADDVAALLAEQ